MAITEFALLHLTAGNSIDNDDIRSKLSHAKTVMQSYTNRKFYILQQIEDPTCLYVIGEWDSLDQHMNHFIPSAENQSLLKSLKDQVDVDWLLHIDAPHADLPLPRTTEAKEKARAGELVWSIVRYFMKDGEKKAFEDTFEANKHLLQDFVTEGTFGGGWRLDKEDGKEEKVSLCPWTSVKQHFEFAATDDFKKYAQIKDHIQRADIKHAKLLDIRETS